MISNQDSKRSFTPHIITSLPFLDYFNPKKTAGFSKNVFFRKSVKGWFFMTFNIIIIHIFL